MDKLLKKYLVVLFYLIVCNSIITSSSFINMITFIGTFTPLLMSLTNRVVKEEEDQGPPLFSMVEILEGNTMLINVYNLLFNNQ